jgi:hypothetical protein
MSPTALGLARPKKHLGWNQLAILPSNIGDCTIKARRRLA